MPMTPQQRKTLLAQLQSREDQVAKLSLANESLARFGAVRDGIKNGMPFVLRVEGRNPHDDESDISITCSGVSLVRYSHNASPTWTIVGEAIREAAVEAIACQLEDDQGICDQLLCDILGVPMPTEEPERAPRGVRVRDAQ
jgi:hypothetical protein